MVGLATLFILSLGMFCLHAEPIPFPKNFTDSQFPVCGMTNPNNNVIDETEPDKPEPFHGLTTKEIWKLREFLEKDPKIRADKSSNATLKSSYIFMAQLHNPKKDEVLNYLDNNGPQPIREAHVIMFRGDKSPSVVEECVCGPLPDITKCELLNRTSKRNPVEFSLRPLSGLELTALKEVYLKKVDEKVGDILMESYGAKFTGCAVKDDCLESAVSPVGSGLIKDITKRLMWVNAMYKLPFPTMHVLDFSVLINFNDTDPVKWTVEKVWYSDKIFESLEDLVSQYKSGSINKTQVTKPKNDENLFSSLRRRGDFQPVKPQRAPRLVEPDGKRYSVKQKKVEYMGWTFSYRLSPLTGLGIYDVKFKGERIVYEMSLAEIAVLYSGSTPFVQTLNEVDSSMMLGTRSKALLPGAGCPETGTLLSKVFLSQYDDVPALFNASMCIFENNEGRPLRRHLSYEIDNGAFYGGMMDSALTIRSAMTIQNNDYILDYIFHQNGAIETKVMATGYIQTSFYPSKEMGYGHRVQDKAFGNLHHHLASFKVDMDIKGRSNRYETLEISEEKLKLTAFPDKPYSQTKINATLKTTEKDALIEIDEDTPKYHIVHNNEVKNKYNESRAYRIEVKSPSKTLIEQGLANEKSISWARHKMVVTKRKEDEATSSSIYSMLDSHMPALNFTSYYEDDEDIVDEDLVFWITTGFHHLPISEDIPNSAAVGNHLSFFLLPHNYYEECPSISSRDAIFIEHKDKSDPTQGVKVDRNGNSRDQCVLPKSTLEEDLDANPDRIMESRRRNPTGF